MLMNDTFCYCTMFSGHLQIETRNNKLEMHSVNNKSLIEELDKLLERLRIPSEVLPFVLGFGNFHVLCFYVFFFILYCDMIFLLILFLFGIACSMSIRWFI